MTIFLKFLSDTPRYVICSFEASTYLGKELFGYLLVVPHAYCERQWAYAVDDL